MSDLALLIVAPTRRDGEVTQQLLARAGVDGTPCQDMAAVAAAIDRGIGGLLLTDAALAAPGMAAVFDALARQPAWSDVPVLVLVQGRTESAMTTRLLARLDNPTLLDRPTSTRAMVSAVLAALRARRRQYQIRDQIAAQHRAEEALREADRRKDEFLATLAHELRNPLAPIRTGMQILPKIVADGPQFARLQGMMERQLGQLVKLIDELLDVSRIATGKVVLQLETIDMRDVIHAALEGSQPAIEAAGHAVELDLPPAPAWVRGDPARLAQVVGNLLNNAAKYTLRGGRIQVALEADAGGVVVRVSDNGLGIPDDMLDHVFAMFSQVDRTLDRAQGGLGIGLSLVKRLMDLHGGSIAASSAGLGRGSTFTIRLPGAAAPARPAPAQVAVDTAARRRLRVLVVDDNADAADALALSLRLDGYDTETRYSGEAALTAADTFHPHVVFCDIGLPVLGGHEVARRLRAQPRHARAVLVALTGWGSEEDQLRSRAAGFDVHLVKPASMASISGVLRAVEASMPAGPAPSGDAGPSPG